ncbi:MAG TPA: hypothetical protein VIM03_05360 [Thermoleophilaceae bacterium]
MALTSADLTAALSEHERRSVGDRRAEGLTIGERLYSSPHVHRLIPDRGAMAIAWLVGTVQWLLSKGLRAEAVEYMSLLLEGTPRSHEARSLGRRHLIESSAAGLALWRPRMLRGARLDGISNLEQVERKGAGAILLSMHVGANHLGNSQPLLRRGLPVHVLGGEEWLFPDRFVGYDGHRAVTLRRLVEEVGGHWIRPRGAYQLCEALLRRGDLCLIPFDVPGGHETEFLNKWAWVRSGVARLSIATGAPIVPVFAGREGDRFFVRLEAPIDPEDHPGLDELVDHLARVVGSEILRRPAERERTPFLGSVWSEPGTR